MSVAQKFEVGTAFPSFGWERMSGGRVVPSDEAGWRLVIVYRGKHCPICRSYLGKVDERLARFADLDVSVWAVSADPLDRAREEATAEGWALDILAGLREDEMRTLGLYISSPRSADETDRDFAEPAMFLIRPDNIVHSADIASAPFYRPEIDTVLDGIKFIQENDYPVRGVVD